MTISRAYGTWSNGMQQRTFGKDHWTGRFAASKKEVTSICRSRQKLAKDHLHDGWVQRFSVEEEWVGAVAAGRFMSIRSRTSEYISLAGTFWAAITRAAMALNLISEPISNTFLDE